MNIEKVDLISFKGFKNFSVDLFPFTALVGCNNSGKTSILQAIQLVFDILCFTFGGKEKPDYGRPHWEHDPSSTFQKLSLNEPEAVWLNKKTSDPCSITLSMTGDVVIQLVIKGRTKYSMDVLHRGTSLKSSLQDANSRVIIEDLCKMQPVLVPPIGTVSSMEDFVSHDIYVSKISQGKSTEYWRGTQFWQYNDKKERFQDFKIQIQKYLPDVTLLEPRLSHSNPPKIEIRFEEHSNDYDISFSGGGLRTIINLISVLTFTKSKCFLFDEPDAHLHGTLQREMCQMLRDYISGNDVQIITASHSPDFLSEIPISNLIWIDRNQSAGQKCNDNGKVLVDLGAITNVEAIRAYGADKILFIEGDLDKKLYKQVFELSGKRNPFNDSCVIVAQLPNGKGDKKYLNAFSKLLSKSFLIDSKIACIVDKDFDSEREDDGKSVKVVPLNRKEIENYLIEPEIWHKVLVDKGKEVNLSTIQEMTAEIINKDDIKRFVEYQLKPRYRDKLENSLDPSTKEQKADRWFERQWEDELWRLSHCPGKLVLREIRSQVREKFSVTVSDNDLIRAMGDLSEDLKRLSDEINTHFYSS